MPLVPFSKHARAASRHRHLCGFAFGAGGARHLSSEQAFGSFARVFRDQQSFFRARSRFLKEDLATTNEPCLRTKVGRLQTPTSHILRRPGGTSSHGWRCSRVAVDTPRISPLYPRLPAQASNPPPWPLFFVGESTVFSCTAATGVGDGEKRVAPSGLLRNPSNVAVRDISCVLLE